MFLCRKENKDWKLLKNFIVANRILNDGCSCTSFRNCKKTLYICVRKFLHAIDYNLSKAGFTLHNTLPSLLDHPRICQCKRGGARARPGFFLSCASFLASSTARGVSDYRLIQPIELLLFQRMFIDRNYFISYQLPLNKLSSKSKVHLL